jgi:hypothetical protein
MVSGSHEPDWQVCTQNAIASLSTTAAGADITAGAGTLGGTGFSESANNRRLELQTRFTF